MKLFGDLRRLYRQVRFYIKHRESLRALKEIKRNYVLPKTDLVPLRKELLEGMCHCAENISTRREGGSFFLKFEEGYFPTSFKPGVADKFLFQRMIGENLPKIVEERESNRLVREVQHLRVILFLLNVIFQNMVGVMIEKRRNY